LTQVASATTAAVVTLTVGVGANAVPVKGAYAWKANDFQVAANGEVSAVDVSGAVPSALSRVLIGSVMGLAASGAEIATSSFYRYRLSSAQLAKMTT
jgi:hypothetical protein